MDFFIRQGATEPILKLRLVDDGKNDKTSFNERLENAVITFDMIDVKTGNPQILDASCELATRILKFGDVTDELFITYTFSEDDTLVKGRFEGTVTIQFLDSSQNHLTRLIVPVREKLYINII